MMIQIPILPSLIKISSLLFQRCQVEYLGVTLNILLFLLAGCISNSYSDEADVDDQVTLSETIEPTPEYIYRIWPEPGSSELAEEYRTLFWYDSDKPSVCVEFEAKAVVEIGDFYTSEELLNRVSLEIDNLLINKPDYVLLRDTEGYYGPMDALTNEPMYYIPEGSPYFICFEVDLEVGKHIATLIAHKTSGNQILYNWEFSLEP